MWNASLATGLIVAALVVGFLLYLLGKNVKTRRTEAFIGGEDLRANPQMRLSGTEFYHTIEELGILKVVYHLAKEKVFDVYEMGVKVVLALSRVLKYIHNGVLPTYLAWCILGLALFFWVFFK